MAMGGLSLPDAAVHAFADALQGVVVAVVVSSIPSPSLAALAGRVATLSLLYLRFACGVSVDGDLPPIWEVVARLKGRVEGLATLNQTLMRGLPSCCRLFGGGRN